MSLWKFIREYIIGDDLAIFSLKCVVVFDITLMAIAIIAVIANVMSASL